MYQYRTDSQKYLQHKSSGKHGSISIAEYKRKFKETCRKNRKKRKKRK